MQSNLNDLPVRHVLLLRFKPAIPAEKIGAFIDAFRDLSHTVEGVVGFEHGPNNSPEGLSHGYEYAVALTFANLAARDAYLPHPQHLKFVDFLNQLAIIDEILVLDYSPKE